MRILLDECLPRRLKRELPGHFVRTVPETGWAGRSNGELLALAEGTFDVFVTVDQNLVYQQDLSSVSIAVVVLTAGDNRFATLKPLVPIINDTLTRIRPGEIVHLSG